MINADNIIERANLKKQISMWRLAAFILIAILLIKLFGGLGGVNSISPLTQPYIARISIDNVIYRDVEREEILQEIKKDNNIKAVVMNVNSPGGTAVGGETLYKLLKEINEVKPVISVMGSMATSAGYMITLGTERIYAHNGTITGSVGVIMQIPNFKEAANSLGIEFYHIKSSPLKGSPSPFEEKNEAALKVIEQMMDDYYDFFKTLVREERQLSKTDFNYVVDGKVFSGKKALEYKLIDAIGTEAEAVSWLKEQHNLDEDMKIVDVELFKPEAPIRKFLGSFLEKIGINNLLPEKITYTGLLN